MATQRLSRVDELLSARRAALALADHQRRFAGDQVADRVLFLRIHAAAGLQQAPGATAPPELHCRVAGFDGRVLGGHAAPTVASASPAAASATAGTAGTATATCTATSASTPAGPLNGAGLDGWTEVCEARTRTITNDLAPQWDDGDNNADDDDDHDDDHDNTLVFLLCPTVTRCTVRIMDTAPRTKPSNVLEQGETSLDFFAEMQRNMNRKLGLKSGSKSGDGKSGGGGKSRSESKTRAVEEDSENEGGDDSENKDPAAAGGAADDAAEEEEAAELESVEVDLAGEQNRCVCPPPLPRLGLSLFVCLCWCSERLSVSRCSVAVLRVCCGVRVCACSNVGVRVSQYT